MVKRRTNAAEKPPAGCALTECLKIVGGAWTPNIVWYLKAQPRRFTELKSDLAGISAKTLTARLRRLERDGILHREVIPSSPPTVEYSLTPTGRKLIPAVEAIARAGHELKLVRSRRETATIRAPRG
ncbi:MAG: helix-turn-helix transcriptional regulator [Acidobacteria bacterium]|nr:helix-turn-helix transcriptional regulator [Acidobacteriota bacterium]